MEEMVQKLNYSTIVKAKKVEEEEEAITFDIKSKPRVVLHDGRVSVRSK